MEEVLHVENWQQELKNVLNCLDTSLAEEDAVKPWALMVQGLVGAGLSLDTARLHCGARRKVNVLLKQSLALMESPERFLVAGDRTLKEWFVGFHLNNAEHRLVAVYEQLLKTLVRVTKGNIPHLEERFLERFDGSALRPAFEAAARALKPIQRRNNQWKHDATPYVDREKPECRLREAYPALLALVSFFLKAAVDRGVVSARVEGAPDT